MSIVRTLAKSLRKYKKETIITPIFISVEVLMECTIPLLISRIINTLEKSKNLETGSGGLLQSIIIYGLILVAMAGISLLSGIMAAKFGSRASAGFATNLRKDMFYNIQNFSFANIDKFSTPSLVTRLTTDVTNVQQAFMMIIRIGVRAPLMMAFAMVISFTFHATLPLVFLIVVPILGSGMYLIITKAHPLFKKVFQKYDNLNNSVQENIRGMRVVKSYVREDYEINKFKKTASDVRKDFIKAERIIAFTGPLMTFCMYICMLAISYFGAKIIISSNASALEVGELSSLITYSMQILSSLMMFSFVFLMCTISAESADRIAEVIREKSTITNPENPVYELQDGSVSFKNVSFKYSERAKRYALGNINLDIKTGETIGILGGTGSSKTSLIQLIPRLYDATEGEVYVGSRNVKEYDLDTLRNGVAVVLQKNTLFSGTIEENLRWGNKDATMEEIKEACQLAQAEEFIERFPEKYNTYIEQGGTNVSGGQKQRLCIARALLKKPKILILDDSTSAVDTKTDALIRNGLKNYLPDTTKIIIAQRVASVENADKIVIMDNGTINQIGTHEELLKTNKIYQEVYYSQNKVGDTNE